MQCQFQTLPLVGLANSSFCTVETSCQVRNVTALELPYWEKSKPRGDEIPEIPYKEGRRERDRGNEREKEQSTKHVCEVTLEVAHPK